MRHDRRVDGAAALREDAGTGFGRCGVRRSNHRVLRTHRRVGSASHQRHPHDGRRGKKQRGEWLSPAAPAYRDSQAVPYLNTIYTQIGNPASPFSLGDEHWVIPAEFDKDQSPASAVLLFCPSGNKRRYLKLFPILDGTVAEYDDAGGQLVWISYPKSKTEDPGVTFEKLLAEWDEKNIENTFLLLDDIDSSVHLKYEATRGSGDLYVIDAEGNVQWRVIDPMYWDDGLIRSVLNRVFRE